MPHESNDATDAGAEGRTPAERSRRRQRRALLFGVVGVAVTAFALWWFQPQTLLFDDVVDEAFPSADREPGGEATRDGEVDVDAPPAAATASPDTDDAPDVALAGPVELAVGSFVSRSRYTVTGTATAYLLEEGERILRLEDFESTNGPDLFVYLTVAGAADDDAEFETDFVDLGRLTGNVGAQNYAIPPDVDLERFDSVVIWCRRFTTSFGVADLTVG